MAGDEPSPPPRERPWLLPYNRKLRHLQGITIRNLTLQSSSTRSRTKTIDDDAIPSTLKSPTKSLALRESRVLSHSRSSSDLKSSEDVARHSNGDIHPTSPKKPVRPGAGIGLRRRSTWEWTTASPLTRQKKLEDIAAGRMADTFFSLHIEHQEEPVYISEVAEQAMNPNFKFFDLLPCGPGVTRLDKLTVKVWAKNEETDGWQFLIDYTVHFNSLQFIGKTLGKFRHPLPPNCVLFHMTDGIYTTFTHLPVSERTYQQELAPPKETPAGRPLNTSSYDALMRLSTLDDCIQDAVITRDRLVEEIETILDANKDGIAAIEKVPEAQERLKTVEGAVTTEKRRVDAVRRRRDELKASIQQRRTMMQKGREMQEQAEKHMHEDRQKHDELKHLVAHVEEDIVGQRRRVCEDVLRIFPIEPVTGGKSLLFSIRGLALPNAEFDDAKEDVTAAALGYVAQVLSQLSLYLGVILPYPVTPNGSTSTIDDPLAMGHHSHNNPRTYPLFMKGIVRYRFEYAVFLLNKNIEILSNSLGLRPLDIRHTLPNLKYLLFVATAGKGELPSRKSGGIKALLRQDGVLSRKGSMDSTATGSSSGAPRPPERKDAAHDSKSTDGVKANGGPVAAPLSFHRHKAGVLPHSKLRDAG